MTTVVDGDFEWDAGKAAANLAKHGVSFEEAESALVDPAALFYGDDASGDARTVAIGMSGRARVLLVVHVERGERVRIISARGATPAEQIAYADG